MTMTTSETPQDEKNLADLIITPDMIESGQAGTVSYWKLSGSVELPKLAEAWKAQGLNAAMLPSAPSAETALRRAVGEQGSKRRLIRPLKRRGAWAIVAEATVGDRSLDYAVEARVFWSNGKVEIEGGNYDLGVAIREGFERHKDTLSPEDVSGWLVKRIEALMAVSLRDTGGVYFVPRESVATWRAICTAVESAATHKVFRIPAMKNSEAAAAILDAITAEAEAAATAIETELEKGADDEDAALGGRALATRDEHCRSMIGKIGSYERILGVRLDALRERFGRLQADITAATLLTQSTEAERGAA